MEPRDLIDKSSLGPKALHVIYTAFDDAWAQIVSDYPVEQAEAARIRLAKALLEVANDDSDSPGVLKRMALELMASSSS
jgi:hypothetical protein